MDTLRDLDVVRAVNLNAGIIRATDGGMPKMDVRFSIFNTWYEINSMWEGTFLERTSPGAFKKTIAENKSVKVLFNHGMDPQIGDKVMGVVDSLREESDSPIGIVSLFDTSWNRDLLSGLEAGVYGSSFKMRVVKDEWNDMPKRSEHNPDGLPERTIKEVRLYEFGPVTWPANPAATAGLRSMTDQYYERLRSADPAGVRDLELRAQQLRTPATVETPGAAEQESVEPTNQGHSGGLTPSQRRERIYPFLKGAKQ